MEQIWKHFKYGQLSMKLTVKLKHTSLLQSLISLNTLV
uniref:Uncharacterized protein n=1 Tax=Anguilla anguilla TaxID=7936 RepID=A0A0E9PHB6_ANGAN